MLSPDFTLLLLTLVCLLQLFTNYLEYRRTKLPTKLWFGVIGFTLMTLGFLLFRVNRWVDLQEELHITRQFTSQLLRVGIILWALDSLGWIIAKTRIIR